MHRRPLPLERLEEERRETAAASEIGPSCLRMGFDDAVQEATAAASGHLATVADCKGYHFGTSCNRSTVYRRREVTVAVPPH